MVSPGTSWKAPVRQSTTSTRGAAPEYDATITASREPSADRLPTDSQLPGATGSGTCVTAPVIMSTTYGYAP